MCLYVKALFTDLSYLCPGFKTVLNLRQIANAERIGFQFQCQCQHKKLVRIDPGATTTTPTNLTGPYHETYNSVSTLKTCSPKQGPFCLHVSRVPKLENHFHSFHKENCVLDKKC